MATGVTLSEMLDMLRIEAGLSLSPAHSVSLRVPQIHLLRRVQEELYVTHDWPSLLVFRDKNFIQGERYYSLPDDLNFEYVNDLWVQNGAQWERLTYGIDPDDYNVYNSDDAFQTFPPTRWRAHPDENRQFELWPVPSQDGLLRFYGRKSLKPLVEDSDVSTLDATVITLFAAAEILAKSKSEDAQIKLQKAQNLLRSLKYRQSATKDQPTVVGGGGTGYGPRPRAGIDFIPMKG